MYSMILNGHSYSHIPSSGSFTRILVAVKELLFGGKIILGIGEVPITSSYERFIRNFGSKLPHCTEKLHMLH